MDLSALYNWLNNKHITLWTSIIYFQFSILSKLTNLPLSQTGKIWLWNRKANCKNGQETEKNRLERIFTGFRECYIINRNRSVWDVNGMEMATNELNTVALNSHSENWPTDLITFSVKKSHGGINRSKRTKMWDECIRSHTEYIYANIN